ncbi:MAG TPA: hypothetical protein VHS09_01935 [Polyangiaceae bacterium]|jgi:hypothetical protein|nr:hypothetical protein [Polyangiaceae bacterium]
MRPTVVCSFALLLAAAACGGAKKNADSPANTDDSAADGGAATETPPAADDSAPSSGAPVPGDDKTKKPTPCGGFEIPDLLSVLSQAACEVQNPSTSDQPDLKDKLEIRVVPDSPRIAPGSTATVTVTFKNKSKGDLPLNFVVDPEPRFDFAVFTLKGSRVDAPKGNAPSLPPEVANATVPEAKVARITLATQGTAKVTLKWNAVKYKWASKERAKGALPGQGYPREPAGPLPKGTYILRVITPLTNVFEGVDHDASQPRVQITVAPMP